MPFRIGWRHVHRKLHALVRHHSPGNRTARRERRLSLGLVLLD